MSILLDIPHLATVKTIAPSRFYVSDDGSSLMRSDPAFSLAVSRLLARRQPSPGSYRDPDPTGS